MSEWKECLFSDFVNINPLIKMNKGQKYSFIEMKDLNESNKYCSPSTEREFTGGSRFENGDTLFARITPCLENGKICQAKGLRNGVGFGSTEFYVFRGKAHVSDTNFVFYLSRWDEVRNFAEMNFDGTSGRQRVPKTAFDSLYITIPPIHEQKIIAEILGSLDDKIELLQRNNKNLEAMAETIFRQWFVEGENNSTPGTFKEFLSDILSGDWGKEKAEGKYREEVLCIRGTDIGSFQKGIHENMPVRFIKKDKLDKCKLESGDIVIEISGGSDDQSTGRTMYANDIYLKTLNKPAICSNFCRILRTKKKEYMYFLYMYISYLYDRGDLFNLENGTSGIRNLDVTALVEKIKYPMPSENLIKKYHEMVKNIFEKIQFNNAQIRNLESLRDNLLPMLISGDLKVAL
jgi:type I restriction enzyme S subunit